MSRAPDRRDDTFSAELASLLSRAELIDLTVTIAENLPSSWPSHVPFQQKIWNWFAPVEPVPHAGAFRSIAPYQTRWSMLDDHTGTHVDAPTHWVPPSDSGLPNAAPLGDVPGEAIPLRPLFGPADVVDCTHLTGTGAPGASPLIGTDLLDAWEARHGPIAPGDVVLLRTGWDRHYRPGRDGNLYHREPLIRKKTPAWPAPAPELIVALHERGVATVGTDGASMGAAHDTEAAHRAGLSRGMLFVEVLTGLDRLSPRGAFFVFLPIKIAGATGEPGRAIALVERMIA